jgi:transposase InsO family protein
MDNLLTLLNEYYYNIRRPASFQSSQKLYKIVKKKFPKVTLKNVSDWLYSQRVYSVHRPIKLKFKRNPIVSKMIDHNWHLDLVEISHPEENDNYRYILMVIDVLSKYGWAVPLKNKGGITVKGAFQNIMLSSKRQPKIVSTDAGKEFVNYYFKSLLLERKIKHLIAKGTSKAAVVERWNRTIKEKIQKYLTYKRTNKFIDVLPAIIFGYNHTVHSRTKFKPIDVNKSNQYNVFKNLYKFRTPLEKQKFNMNDPVRVNLTRGTFEKGYKQNYSKEIFYIDDIYYTSPYYKYRVRDREGDIVIGSYYGKELVKVSSINK